MLLNGDNYYPFIKTLYQGMGDYYFQDLTTKLYIGTIISEVLNQ